ncbi:MAG: adenosylcobinamide-GDP ribazoletransferase [Prevotella sp.]|nr:adenosylcobinamide-GDP ribazoletransferase [Prevotella sp.]
MQTSLNTSKWYDRIWAAFIFFTRLPLWRIYQPPRLCYTSVVEWWPLVGWLTGGVMASILFFGSQVLPYSVVILLAIIARILLTGALHEDGLADFFDGFGGGGTDRRHILAIMKDSHIGAYGVLGLILYIALLYLCLHAMTPQMAAMTVLAADPYAKMLGAQITQMMPYARTEETSKAHTVYRRMSLQSGILLAIQGLLPISLYVYLFHNRIDWQWLLFVPCLTMYFLYMFVWRRLRGYTGDCCGAFFLLIELSFYLVATQSSVVLFQ